jgi:transcriptional regulator with XRE-family HTH domain
MAILFIGNEVLVMKKVINLDYLKEYMEQNKISEAKLAELISVNYTTVYRVFKGNRNPGAKFITGLIKSGLNIDLKKVFSNN